MSKLNPNQPSKLLSTPLPQEKSSIVIPDKIKMGGSKRTTTPTTFSFKEIDKERLKYLEERIRKITTKKITTVDIIRGLLILSENTDEAAIMLHIQKSFLE